MNPKIMASTLYQDRNPEFCVYVIKRLRSDELDELLPHFTNYEFLHSVKSILRTTDSHQDRKIIDLINSRIRSILKELSEQDDEFSLERYHELLKRN